MGAKLSGAQSPGTEGSATTKYACLNCPGTPTCSYDCS